MTMYKIVQTEEQKSERLNAIREGIITDPDSEWDATAICFLLSEIDKRDERIQALDKAGISLEESLIQLSAYKDELERRIHYIAAAIEGIGDNNSARDNLTTIANFVDWANGQEAVLQETKTELHQTSQLYAAGVHERLKMAETEERLANRYKEAVRIANQLMRLISRTDQAELINSAHEIMSGEIIEGVEQEREREESVRSLLRAIDLLSVHPDTSLANDIEDHLLLAVANVQTWLPGERRDEHGAE